MAEEEWVESFELHQGRRRWGHERLLYNPVVNTSDVTLKLHVCDRTVNQVQVNQYTGGKTIFLEVTRVEDGVATVPVKLFRGFNELVCTTFDAGQRRYARQVIYKTSFREWVETMIFAMVLALVIRTFFIQAFVIPSASMEDTLTKGDRILVNKIGYFLFPPRRPDVVVFEWPRDQHQIFIKRIIGLGGERLRIVEGKVILNGTPIHEPYIRNLPGEGEETDKERQVRDVAPGTYFVLGDNRKISYDSRAWGPVHRRQIVGRAFLKYWPWDRAGWIY